MWRRFANILHLKVSAETRQDMDRPLLIFILMINSLFTLSFLDRYSGFELFSSR